MIKKTFSAERLNFGFSSAVRHSDGYGYISVYCFDRKRFLLLEINMKKNNQRF